MSKDTQQLFIDMNDNQALASAMRSAKNADDVLAIGRKFGYELTLEAVLEKIQENDVDEQQLGNISAAGYVSGIDPISLGIGSAAWNSFWSLGAGSSNGYYE